MLRNACDRILLYRRWCGDRLMAARLSSAMDTMESAEGGEKSTEKKTPQRPSKQKPKGAVKPKGKSFMPPQERVGGDWTWRRSPNLGLHTAKNWRFVESLFMMTGVKWKLDELRIAWKRCVYAHLDDGSRQLQPTSPVRRKHGREFLGDLMKATLFQLKKNDWKMSGREARDIGWAAGKQWFMDHRLVDAIQTGLLEGVAGGKIELYQAVPVAWAIANSGQYPLRLFEEFQKGISTVYGHLNLQHCTNTLWAMAVCGYHPGKHFLRTLSDLACDRMESTPSKIIPQAIADLVWSTGRLNLTVGHDRTVHTATKWAFENLSSFSPEELLTTVMGLAMLNSLGLEDMRTFSEAFYKATQESLLDVYVDQFIALTLLFPEEHRSELHETAFGSKMAKPVLFSHHDRQAHIATQMKNNKFLKLISRQLDKVAEGRYEIGTLTKDRNLALEILVHGEKEDYSVIPVYPMSRSRNEPGIELGEVRIAQRLVESQGIKFGGFLEWITPEDSSKHQEGSNTSAKNNETDSV